MNKQGSHHLTYEERVQIELLHCHGWSIRSIAAALHRSKTAVAYELREKQVRGVYTAKNAHTKTRQRRWRSKWQCYTAVPYGSVIEDKLTLRWSPERISGWFRNQGIPISPKAVYKFVHSRCLERYLWKPKRRKRSVPAYLHVPRKFVDSIEPCTSGVWELDFVVCSQNTWCLLVAAERVSKRTLIQHLPDKTQASVARAFAFLTQRVTMHTIVTDNDIAFGCWRELEKMFHVRIFFTHPYRSWEKPLVEQTNQLIRRFIPKHTNLRLVTERKLREVHRFLNETPRQCLGYQTAYETYAQTK